VGADFGHEEDPVAAAFQALAHPVFGLPAMIFPAIVEESNSAIDGFANQPDGCVFVFGIAQMVSAESECRDLDVVPAEIPGENV